jgi:hypothetical protein
MALDSPKQPFSKRRGYAKPKDILIWEDAPGNLRYFVFSYAHDLGFTPHTLRDTICSVLRVRPDPNNFTAYPNVWEETEELVYGCEWYKFYDFIEEIYQLLSKAKAVDADGALRPKHEFVRVLESVTSYVELALRPAKFEADLNEYFIDEGIGWRLIQGQLATRGTETFESNVHGASDALTQAKRFTARDEIHEALVDLSRRPEADLTGAIQHAMAALECVARDVCGGAKLTLGQLVKKYPGTIPKPLDDAVEGAWGYASEMARHIREGRKPGRREVELIVSLAATVVTYLSRAS